MFTYPFELFEFVIIFKLIEIKKFFQTYGVLGFWGYIYIYIYIFLFFYVCCVIDEWGPSA